MVHPTPLHAGNVLEQYGTAVHDPQANVHSTAVVPTIGSLSTHFHVTDPEYPATVFVRVTVGPVATWLSLIENPAGIRALQFPLCPDHDHVSE